MNEEQAEYEPRFTLDEHTELSPTFDGVNVCEDGDCECGMIWDTDADVHIATVRGPTFAKRAPAPSAESRKHLALLFGAAAAADKKLPDEYNSQKAVGVLPDLLLLIEESVNFYRKLHKQTGIEAAKRQAENFDSVLQNARTDQ